MFKLSVFLEKQVFVILRAVNVSSLHLAGLLWLPAKPPEKVYQWFCTSAAEHETEIIIIKKNHKMSKSLVPQKSDFYFSSSRLTTSSETTPEVGISGRKAVGTCTSDPIWLPHHDSCALCCLMTA